MPQFSWSANPKPVSIRPLVAAVAAADGRPSLPPPGDLPDALRGGEFLLATDDGDVGAMDLAATDVVGMAHLNIAGDAFGRGVAELLVHPAHRRRGIGTELALGLLARAGIDAADPPGDRLRVWAHGDQPAAAALAARLGFVRVRELCRLRRDLTATAPLPTVDLPAGLRLRAFRPGADEEAVIAVNRAAFAWHPEQGALTVADLRAAETKDSFDAPGFLLAENEAGEIVGFHWTMVHPRANSGQPMGEVYVVGVRPDAQGGGLGRALTVAGLHYLRDQRQQHDVMLYVESDNVPALHVYRKLGFTPWDADVQYAH